jgi:hypothetical protein
MKALEDLPAVDHDFLQEQYSINAPGIQWEDNSISTGK